MIDIQIESIYTAIVKSMSSMFEMHGKLLSSDLSFLEIRGLVSCFALPSQDPWDCCVYFQQNG